MHAGLLHQALQPATAGLLLLPQQVTEPQALGHVLQSNLALP